MQKRILTLMVVIPILFTACSNTTATPVAESPTPSPQIPPTKTATSQPTITPTTIPTQEEVSQPVLPSECTVVSALPEPPAELVELFSVSENDWVVGPEDAAVTLIEYGDFQ